MYIEEYAFGNFQNHRPNSQRRLLLNKKELKKLHKDISTKGMTIIPLKLFMTSNGWAKLEIGLCKGKKLYDKRESLKTKDSKRDLDRLKKQFNN